MEENKYYSLREGVKTFFFFIAYTKEYAHYNKKNIFGTVVGTRLGTWAAKSGTGLGQSNKNKLK